MERIPLSRDAWLQLRAQTQQLWRENWALRRTCRARGPQGPPGEQEAVALARAPLPPAPDETPALQAWQAALHARLQHALSWSAGLRQLWTLGRAHRSTDAFYFYHYLLDHPAFAEAS